jgi:hypothetical protein
MQPENNSPNPPETTTTNTPTNGPKSDKTLPAPLTAEVIEEAISNGAKSLTEIARFLGKKGTISGKLAKQIKALIPNITVRLSANDLKTAKDALKGAAKDAKTGKQAKSAKTGKSGVKGGKYPRHAKNPFRAGSSYALAFDIFAGHPKGIARPDLTKEYAKASRKPLKNASFDIAVLLSPKGERATSERHRSCREGYGLKRDGNHFQIVLP